MAAETDDFPAPILPAKAMIGCMNLFREQGELLGRVFDHDPAASVSLFAPDRRQGADQVEPHERCIIGFPDIRPEGVVGSAELLFILRAELDPVRPSRQVLYAAHVRKADDLIAGSLQEDDVSRRYPIVGRAAVL